MASTEYGCWSCLPLRRRTRHPEHESARGVSRKTRQIFVKVRMPEPQSSRSAGGEKKPSPYDSDAAPSVGGALSPEGNRTSIDQDEGKEKVQAAEEPAPGPAAVAVKIRKTSFFGMFRRPVGGDDDVVHVPFGETCVICMEKFKPNEVLEVLLCQHLYHERCIKRWLGDHTSCCVCKADMEEMARAIRKRKPTRRRRRPRRPRSRSETRSERSASFTSESGYASDQDRSAFSSMSAPAALADRTLPPDTGSGRGSRSLAGGARDRSASSSTSPAAPTLVAGDSNSSNNNSSSSSSRSVRTLPFPRYDPNRGSGSGSGSGGGGGRIGRGRSDVGSEVVLGLGPWSVNSPTSAPVPRPLAPVPRPLAPRSPAAVARPRSARSVSTPARGAASAAAGSGTGISALTALSGNGSSPGARGGGSGRRPMLRLSLSAFPPPEWNGPIGGGDSEERSSSSSSSSSCRSISSINSDGDGDHSYFSRVAQLVNFDEEKPRGQPLRRRSSSTSKQSSDPSLRSPRIVHTPRSRSSPQLNHVLARSPRRWSSNIGNPATAPSPRRASPPPPPLPSTPRERRGEFPFGVAALSTPQRAERRRRPPSPCTAEPPLSSGQEKATTGRRRCSPTTPGRVKTAEIPVAVLTGVPTSARSTPGRRCRQGGFTDREMGGGSSVIAGKGRGGGGRGGRGEGKRRVVWGEGKLTAEEERRCSRGSGRITTKSNGNGNHPGENDEDVGVVGAERPRGQQRRREGAAAVGMDRDNSYVPPPPRLSLPPQTSTTPAEDGDRKPEDLSLLTAGKLNGWARAHVDEEDCSEDFEKASTSERGSHKTCSTQWSEMESTLSGTSSGFSMLQAGEEGGSGGAGVRPLRRRFSSPAEVLPTSPRSRHHHHHHHHHRHQAPAVAEEKFAPSLAVAVSPRGGDADEGRHIGPWDPRGGGIGGTTTPPALTPGGPSSAGLRTPGALRDRSESAPMIWD